MNKSTKYDWFCLFLWRHINLFSGLSNPQLLIRSWCIILAIAENNLILVQMLGNSVVHTYLWLPGSNYIFIFLVYKKSQNLVMIIIETTKPFNLKFFIIFGPILNTKWLFINIFLGRGEGRQIWTPGLYF